MPSSPKSNVPIQSRGPVFSPRIWSSFFWFSLLMMACLVHESVTHCSFWIMLKFLDLSKLINLFLQVVTWICQKIYMDLLKLLLGFVTVLLCISCPLPNKTKLKFDQDFKACWSFCFEQKVLNESKNSMPWVRCAFGNI